jgi:4-diphosphocytidyl-2C-methyl-D-erythritol kinase
VAKFFTRFLLIARAKPDSLQFFRPGKSKRYLLSKEVLLNTNRNALESIVFPAYPAVAKLWEELVSERPCFASMTGSGSALYAIFDRESRAAEVAERFSVRGLFASVAKPAKQAVDIR